MRWLRSWWGCWRVRGARWAVVRAELSTRRLLHRMARTSRLLDRERRRLEAIAARVEADLAGVAEQQRRSDEAVESLRKQVDLYEKITVPGLVEAHQAMVEQTRALIALYVQQQALARPASEGPE